MPHIDGRYASVGVVAEVIEQGELPGGLPALVVRGDRRATIGTGVPGHRRPPCGWRPRRSTSPSPPRAAVDLAREYRAVLENILLTPRRGAGSPRSCAR